MTESNLQAENSRHIPPHSTEAERSVLGALLLDSNAYSKVSDTGLEAIDFYREAHGKIFEAIQDLVGRAEPVDLITLTTNLKNRNTFEQIGGSPYLTGLFEDSYSSAHVTHYSKIVKEKAILRRMISTANDLVEKAYGGVENVEEYLDLTEKSVFEVTDTKLRQSFSPIRQILVENIHMLESLADKKSTITGLATGFKDLDEKTSGLHPGNLVIVAGRPAMGKTSFVLNIAERAAIRNKASVAVFSLEMAKEELGMRLLSGVARIDASRLKTGRLGDHDWKNLTRAAGQLSASKIFIDDTPAITVLEMRSRCRRLLADHGLNLIIVDYLQLMRGSAKGMKGPQNREGEISEISRSLKALAKELRCPVIALSQLNRSVESRPDKRPMLSDLRESGAIEQDADIVSFVYRDEVYNKETEDKGIAELILAKHRAGSTGTVRLRWQAEFTAFDDLTDEFRMPAGYGAGAESFQGPGSGLPDGFPPAGP
ncbi:MAG: replicative DNA helicase, partial [Deltaproteobacteria bacterium]|nr:replicative DNA helicase [Deltaproteobacteria bacterium]